MARETGLWDWLKKARDHFGDRLHMRRVENSVGIGDSDVEGVLDGEPFVIELKVAKRPARKSTVLKFGEPIKQEQIEFMRRRLLAGSAAAFLIQVGAGAEREVYVVHAALGDVLAAGVTEEQLQRYRAGTPEATIQFTTNLKKSSSVHLKGNVT